MSAACASPASNGGVHDVLRSRMRIDTTGNPSYERQHDERSLLSVGSFEDVCGISPNSYVHINFDDVVDFAPASERALSTDIDMNDWQMFPSLPHSPYNNPRSVSGESNGHARQDVSQRVPRNFSVPSSSSSAGHSTGHLLSPYTSSPEERFSSTPFLSSAQPQHQQASMDQQTLDAMFAFTTAAQAQFQNLTTTAPAYTSRLSRHAVPRYPHQMGYNTSAHGMPIQESWSTQGPTRIPYTADAGAPVFGLDYTLSDASFNHFSVPATTAPTGTDYSISPGTRDSPMNQQHQPQWPLPTMSGPFEDQSYLDTSLLMAVEGGGAELERTMSFPHSLTSSEVGTSRQQHDSSDDVGTVSGPRKLSITPPVYIKQEDQPMTHSRIKNYRFEPYASPAAPHPHLRQVGPRRPPTSRRVGGRILGTKFDPQKAEKIKERREDGACWVCSLQRDECSGGLICHRCTRRASRPNGDASLGCDRTKLQDLKDIFVPSILTTMYEEKAVEDFARMHIGYWHKKAIIVPCKLIWGFEAIDVEMYEFHPRDEVIRHSVLGVTDWDNNKAAIEKMRSPPLGLSMIDRQDLHKFNEEIDDIVNNWLHLFVERFYPKKEDDFAPSLLRLMAEFCRSPAEETKFLRDVFRLLVVTYYLSHAVTIAESRREPTLKQMSCYQPGMYEKHCGPKLANRQLKHLFSTLRDRLIDKILKQLSQFLKSSKRHERWTAAFCAILGLAVAQEQSQQLVHLILDTEVDEGKITPHEARRAGEKACEIIDERFDFVTKLFRLKYHQKFNPLKDRSKPMVREQLGERAYGFIEDVASLAAHKFEFLRDRARERISCDNQLKYTGRLQASFLLSFWPPS